MANVRTKKKEDGIEGWNTPPPSRMEKLITGTGRCGTTYLAYVLKGAGAPVWHEEPKAPIVISWGFAARWTNKEHGLHLVRQPLKCIRSLAHTKTTAWLYAQYHIEKRFGVDLHGWDMLHKCMYRYHAWNSMCEEVTCHTFQVEQVDQHADLLADFCGVDQERILRSISNHRTDINHRTQRLPELTWDMLFETDEELAQKIKNQTERYGY